MADPADIIADQMGGTTPPADDPAFAQTDPLSETKLRARAGIVHRDIPLIVSATALTVSQVRAATVDLYSGLFDAPAQVIDVLTGDSRVAAGLASRVGGLLGRSVDFRVPRAFRDSPEAKECRDAFADAWETIAPEPFLAQLQRWAVMLGLGFGQMPWDLTGKYAIPRPMIWHPRYTWYHWTFRRTIANTQDGAVPIEPGDGHWIEHAPWGRYRGWMHGAMRPIAPWMVARNLALRDAARWSSANGNPLLKLKHPASADRNMVEQFRVSMSERDGEICVDLPQAIPEAGQAQGDAANFDVDALEFEGKGFEGFFRLIDACDREITLALQAQTLTSDIGPEGRGSWAAARVHADTKQALLEADARALERTIYMQIARPFALLNFGNADLAPRVVWDITPYEDRQTKATTLLTFTQSLANMRNAGLALDPDDVARLASSLGLNLGRVRIAEGISQPPPRDPPRTTTAAPADEPPRRNSARARFVQMADRYMRYRIDMGASERDLRAETEALEALMVERSSLPRRRMVHR